MTPGASKGRKQYRERSNKRAAEWPRCLANDEPKSLLSDCVSCRDSSPTGMTVRIIHRWGVHAMGVDETLQALSAEWVQRRKTASIEQKEDAPWGTRPLPNCRLTCCLPARGEAESHQIGHYYSFPGPP